MGISYSIIRMHHKLRNFILPVFLVLFLISYPIWLPWIGLILVVSDPLQQADALVILAGDENERIARGAELFRQGYASWFVLTDMQLDRPDSAGGYSRVVKRKSIAAGIPEDRILIAPGTVATTQEEAIEIRKFAESENLQTLLIVTSPYHTRRARWIFNEIFQDSGIRTIIQSIPGHSYRAREWWRNPKNRKITALEYLKLGAHLIGYRDVKE